MCVGELKKGIYPFAKMGSQSVAELGRATGWDWLRDEGKRGQENPGYALTRAVEAAGLGYAAALGAASAGTAAEVAPAVGATTAADSEAALAAQQAAQQGLLANSVEYGMADTGYTPSSLLNAAQYGPGSGQSFGQTMGNYASNAAQNLGQKAMNNPMGLLSGGGSKASSPMLAQMGMNLMNPQPQQRQMPAPAPRGGGGSPEPMPLPYGTPAENSLGMLTEEQKKRLRAMGYKV